MFCTQSEARGFKTLFVLLRLVQGQQCAVKRNLVEDCSYESSGLWCGNTLLRRLMRETLADDGPSLG